MNGRIETVGIIGTGIMGQQLSELLITKGYRVIAKTRIGTDAAVFSDRIKSRLSKKNDSPLVDSIMSKLSTTTSYSDLSSCDLLLEASKEDFEIKKDILAAVSAICKKDAIIATNTSSISINKLSEHVSGRDRFLGCHFFNPATKMKLVEIISGKETSKKAIDTVAEFCACIDKITVNAIDSPGFIVNRLLLPQINEAARLLDLGISTIEEIDTAVTLGLNHPMGPLTLADYIGLDTCVSILNILYEETGDPHYVPCKSLTSLCDQGFYGRKSKRGFYEY